jgi:hypothetical protein
MGMSIAYLGERPSGVPAVAWDLVTLLRNDLEGITALTTYKHDAGAAEELAAAELFGQIEKRLREEVGQLQDLLNNRQETVVLPPDFEMPTGEDEVVD